jgi:thermitase
MKFKLYSCRFFGLICLLNASLLGTANGQEVIPGEYLVTYHSSSSSSARSSSRRALGLSHVQEFNLLNTSLVRTSKGRSLNKKTIKDLKQDGIIKSIEPNYRVKALATPNDNKFTELWGLHNTGQTGGTSDIDIDAPEAWNITKGSEQVIVAVLDTGVLYTHPDLSNNMWVNTREIPNNSIDDDNNGIIDDVYGLNAITNSGNPLDDNGHGTHCAGTIAGVGNNGLGVAGVSWNSKIMALKFLSSGGSGSLSDAIQGIQYAVSMKQRGENIRVISNSWGGSGFSTTLENAIKLANSNGILFVAAAGNESNDNDANATYPASYTVDNVVTVAAIDDSGNLASFSNYGSSSVHVAAPGVNIVSTYLGNSYATLSGTSMATPHVSGLAALILSQSSSLTPTQLKSKLISTVKPLASLNRMVKSAGLVSAYRALTDSSTPLPPSPVKSIYTKTTKSYEWNSDLGTRISASDDAYVAINSSFSFPYYGTNYNKFAVSTNGRIQPMTSTENMPTTEDYNSSMYKGISVYNTDLIASNVSSEGGVWFKDLASAIQITWVSVPYSVTNSSSSDKEVRVRAILKSSGEIEMYYNDTFTANANYDYGKDATVSLSPINSASGENLIISSNTPSPDVIGSGKALSISSVAKEVYADFDADGKSDLTVWRPVNGMFYISPSNSDYKQEATLAYQLGLYGDIPKIGDFDGDKKADLAVYRPANGTWYFRKSGSNYNEISSIQWGLPSDIPLLGDVEGDGIEDLIVYRQSAAAFYILLSSSGFNRAGAISGSSSSMRTISLGGPANDPIIGDVDGDGAEDIGAVWQLVRFWTMKNSSNTFISSLPWGVPGDTPLFCKIDGDNTSDKVIVRVEPNNTLSWYTMLGSGGADVKSFGSLGDKPSCEIDTDGDGLGDNSVFRSAGGMWYLKNSSDGQMKSIQFGLDGDIPLLN